MKKIKLTESDLLKIVKRVIREQESENTFDRMRRNITNRVERGDIVPDTEFLDFVFKSILKPPFSRNGGEGVYDYYSRDNQFIGELYDEHHFIVDKFRMDEISNWLSKGTSQSMPTNYWRKMIRPQLKSWLSNRLGVNISALD